MKNYLCRLKLSSFLDARVVELDNEDTDVPERGIFIPIDKNELRVTKNNNVVLNLLVYHRNYTGDGNTHHMKPIFSKEYRSKLKELGYEVPYVATMKPTHILDKYTRIFKAKNKVKEEDV
jgi:hypothetical protein